MLKVTQELTRANVLDWQHAGSLTQDLFTLVIAIHLSCGTHLCFRLCITISHSSGKEKYEVRNSFKEDGPNFDKVFHAQICLFLHLQYFQVLCGLD